MGMKKAAAILFLYILLPFFGFTKAITVFFSCASFMHPSEGRYLEVYFKIPASSLGFEALGMGNFKAGVEISISIAKENDTVYFDKYLLSSPEIKDTSNLSFDLLDLKRAKLQNGKYTVSVRLKDHKTGSSASMSREVEISIPERQAAFSDIMLVDTFYSAKVQGVFTRAGYNFMPQVLNYYNGDKNSLTFYAELYNSDISAAGKEIDMAYYITSESGKIIPGFLKKKKLSPQQLKYVFDGFDIKGLMPGIYSLSLEAKDNTGNILAKKSTGFFRNTTTLSSRAEGASFGVLTARQINDFLEYLAPVATKDEIEQIKGLKTKSDTAAIRSFFVKFWRERDKLNPYMAFAVYNQNAIFAEKNFKSVIKKGYKTDRGRTLLKYGSPDYVSPYVDEQGAYPYEIWQYYKLKSQGNVRFIFYNPTQVENDYILLNSDAIGETKNPNWKQYIYRKINKDTQFDHNATPDNFGNHADERIKE
jgi:GWxTD domain-containing protein